MNDERRSQILRQKEEIKLLKAVQEENRLLEATGKHRQELAVLQEILLVLLDELHVLHAELRTGEYFARADDIFPRDAKADDIFPRDAKVDDIFPRDEHN